MTTSGPGANSQRIEPQNPFNYQTKSPIPLAHMSMQRKQYNPKLKTLLLIRVDRGKFERKSNQLTKFSSFLEGE
jgi:hypothetical protein